MILPCFLIYLHFQVPHLKKKDLSLTNDSEVVMSTDSLRTRLITQVKALGFFVTEHYKGTEADKVWASSTFVPEL